MSTETSVQGYGGNLPADAAPSSGITIAAAEFLKDIRRVKRLTQVGVYSGISATLPIYYLALGLSALQGAVVLAISFLIAVTAIEWAFAEMFKLRKRSAYPGALALQLGALPTFDDACQAMSVIMDSLLHLKACFLTLQNEGGFFTLVALSNLSRVDADRYLRLGSGCIQQAIANREPVGLHPSSSDLLAEALTEPRRQVVFLPVQSFHRVMGILGLIADDSNADLRDRDLLLSLGRALGVSLESLRQRDDLRMLAAIDELTKVYNRHHFFDQIDREIAAARRYEMPLSLLIFDLDGLKKLNDRFGHGLGDEALRTLAQRLVRFSRAADVVARLGGDEFAVILPRTDRAGALDIARRLQSAVENEPLAALPGRELRLAVSCGLASFPEDADETGALIRHADGHMYAAKAARYERNRDA